MQLSLSSLNIPSHCLSSLLSSGFRIVADIAALQPDILCSRCSLNESDCTAVLLKVSDIVEQQRSITSGTHGGGGVSALSILENQQSKHSGSIMTFVQEIDEMLGDGVPLCRITEFCGTPGIGKTQLGIQLAVTVQLPVCFGGVGGHAIYIDTEGSFVPERVVEIGGAFVEKIQGLGQRQAHNLNPAQLAEVQSVSNDSVLENIHYFRCHNYIEQIAVCNVLRDKIRNEFPRTKIIVVDSVAFHFRRDWESNYGLRNRLLNSMARELLSLANEFQLAVVLVNQVTTKIKKGFEAEIVPALGDAWGHTASNRILLYKKHGMRYAKLFKSADRPSPVTVGYTITSEGVQSVAK